jgi:hypothetical protein
MWMKNSSDTIEIRNRDLPTCSTVSQPTALPRLFQRIKIRIMTSHICAVISHVSLLTSPTDSILSTSEWTYRCSYIFYKWKRKISDKTKTYVANSTSEPVYKDIFTKTAFLHTVSYTRIFICGLFNETLNQSVYTVSNGRMISERRTGKHKERSANWLVWDNVLSFAQKDWGII